MIDVINRMIAPLRTRVANMIARAVLQSVDDTVKMQLVQLGVLDSETRANVERVQNYGFTSVPLAGAEAVVVFVGGERGHGLAIAVDDRRYRLTGLQPGEVAFYTDQGDSIVIKRGGTIQITASTAVEIAGNAKSVAHGEDLNSAITTLATAISSAVSGMASGGAASPILGAAATTASGLISTAASAFGTSAAAALSGKVKLG